ncbi:nicotinamide riboside transporter PnuC [Tetragenococcus halophilus]|uniref:nicotinamide riboside transporter PnuC n=1 Tax=Tetragenococcus halophilus TaxID=51669 RepID=UPI0030E87978
MNKKINVSIDVALIIVTIKGAINNGLFTLETLLSCLGVAGVILIAYGRQENFIFNIAQNILNVLVSAKSKLFGDAVMAVYFLGTQFFGIDIWRNHRDENGNLITDNKTDWTVIVVAIFIGGVLLGGLSWLLGGAYIIMDAFNNSTAIVAQYLQIIKRKRVGWALWAITNIVGVYIWLGVGQPQIAIMYLVFTINSIRGYLNWGKLAENKVQGRF